MTRRSRGRRFPGAIWRWPDAQAERVSADRSFDMTRISFKQSRRVVIVFTGLALASMFSGAAATAGAETSFPDVADIVLESPGFELAVAELERAEETISWANSEIRLNENLVEQLGSGRYQIEEAIPKLEDGVDAAAVVVDEAREDLAALAVLKYVMKGSDAELEVITSASGELSAPGARARVIDVAASGFRARLTNATAKRDGATAALATAKSGIGELTARADQAKIDLDRARVILAEATLRLPGLEGDVETERRATRIVGSDLSYIALQAYRVAARAANAAIPECGVDWSLLAGIGRVESRHGTYGGATLTGNGDVRGPIIGIALDGSRNTAVIPDSDGGSLDGDAVFDRAVGPMQFIPSTWRGFGVDGNGDGIADPQNIYDSATAAALYLCDRGSIQDQSALRSAILRYNNSGRYVDAVLVHATRYADLGLFP